MLQLSIAGMSAAACLIAGAIVRHQMVIDQGFWLVEPVFYVRLVEHGVTATERWLFIGAYIAVASITLWLYIRDPKYSLAGPVAELSIGFLIGGVLANGVELASLGAVTDFVGIRTAGIYSAGDLTMTAGIGLLPFLVYQGMPRAAGNRRVGLTAIACVLLVFFGLVIPDRRVIAYVVVIDAVVVGVWWSLRRWQRNSL